MIQELDRIQRLYLYTRLTHVSLVPFSHGGPCQLPYSMASLATSFWSSLVKVGTTFAWRGTSFILSECQGIFRWFEPEGFG